jgi:hypothetical protein
MPTELFIAAPCRGQASNGYRAQQSAGEPPSVLGNGFFFQSQSKRTGQGLEGCWEARLVRKDSFILPRILQDSLSTSFPTFSPFQPDRGLSN